MSPVLGQSGGRLDWKTVPYFVHGATGDYFGSIWRHFWLPKLEVGGGWRIWIEARDAEVPTVTGQPPAGHYLAQSVLEPLL